ncbi:MAG TPA: hypothetical protein VGE52_06425, partial [Pirellulales bacterium]
QTGELMLTNEDGGPLKTEELKDGKLRKIDNIKSAFSRLCVKLGVKHSLIELKKTSATEIKKKFPGLEPLFLGHAPATMSDKHYTTNSPDVLDEALAWLGKQYVLTPEEQPAEPKKNAPKS